MSNTKSSRRQITWELRTVDVQDLIDLDYNPRTISDEEFEQIRESVRKFGLIDKPCVNTDMTLIGGHRRTDVYRAYGLETIEVWWPSRKLTAAEVKELNIRLNRNTGSWDMEKLASFFDPNDLLEWGFQDWELGLDVDSDDNGGDDTPEPEVDRAAELQVKFGTALGQLWQVGRHRLMCGDSTNADHIALLLGEARPELMITDPPYGVEYSPEWRQGALQKRGGRMGKVANDNRADWTDAWRLSPANVVYCWHSGIHAPEVHRSLVDTQFEIRSQIIWRKPSLVISRGHYHFQHEPCWYGVRKGHTANWIGDRKQSTVWDIPTRDGDDQKSHSTQKPIECMRRPIRNHSGDVYEPFAGSGTTLIAAELEDRTCYANELEPGYVGVILERASAMGMEVQLLESVTA
jgi:DNA modification methylase